MLRRGFSSPGFEQGRQSEYDAAIEAAADAIDAARYAHPEHPRERPRPFSEADTSDREYAMRLAHAAVDAIRALEQPQREDGK
jgi:hypothetical protein